MHFSCGAIILLLTACSTAPQPQIGSPEDVAHIRAFLTHVEQVFDEGDLDAAVAVFTDDAMVLSQGSRDAVGKDEIRAIYADALASANLRVRFHTEEIELRGDIAYERGTYDLSVMDKPTGRLLAMATSRHVHVLKRQKSGDWKTWRMFTNSSDAPAPVNDSKTESHPRTEMITKEFAQRFASEWIDAWNAHDLERILSHYTDDFTMSSPRIAVVAGEPTGILRGKDAIRAYWKRAFEIAPTLRFELIDTFVGADSVVLHYNGVRGPSAEVFFFDGDGRVVRAAANYQ